MTKETINSAVTVFKHDLPYSSTALLHVHDFHELFITLSGKGEQLLPNDNLKMKQGDVFFFPANGAHIGNGHPDTPCSCGVIYIHKKMFAQNSSAESRQILNSMTTAAKDNHYKYQLPKVEQTQITALFNNMLTEGRNKLPGYQSILASLLNQLLVILLRNCNITIQDPLHDRSPRNREKVNDALLYLDNNFMNQITIDQMTTLTGMSRSYFHSFFKMITGKTLIDYLNNIRIKAATEHFKSTDLSTEQIAANCGFSSQSQFYKVLKETTGKTPKELKKQHSLVIL